MRFASQVTAAPRRAAARAWTAALFVCLTGAGCASAPSREEGDRLARALARTLRLHYEMRLARMDLGEAPGEGELRAARAALDEALRAAGARPLAAKVGDGAAALEGTVAAARNALLASDYVFLPTAGGADPGIALARVLERTKGLRRSFWGETFHYRRLVHDAPIVRGFAAFAALRAGQAALAPLGRTAGPTVYLDRAAIRRHAERGDYIGVTPEALSELVELTQAASAKLSQGVHLEDLLTPQDVARALEGLHTRVLLTVLRYGEPALALTRLRAVAKPRPGRPPELVAAARRVQAALQGFGTHDPSALRRRVKQLYASLD